MKSKEKPELKARSLFKFEHRNEGGVDTVPTTWTMTITTTGFSKDRPIKREQLSAAKQQV